jgi:Leucine-rich repeat (LRR) protein
MGNNFTGTIPESIYSCRNLTALRLSGNNLHGQLSVRIGELKFLAFISLSFNEFTNITNSLQILKNSSTLTTLIIGNNFKGEAMPEDETIDGFQNLQVLFISGCSLSGKIPLWISKLRKLKVLQLQENQLNGPLPAWIKSLESLSYLDISDNRLTGGIPAALMDMKVLKTGMTATHIDTDPFELTVYTVSSLQYRIPTAFPKALNLGNNKLTGTIPKEIGQLKSLAELNLSFNYLSGYIPQQLCSLTNLEALDLSNNYLTGEIPLALNKLNFLSKFNISYNDLEGSIPTGGQFDTFPNSSFEGNPKLCAIMVNQLYGSAEEYAVPILSKEQAERRVTFVIGFCAFFAIGLLYDQLVLSKFYG